MPELSYLSVIQFSGEDARDFLHRQLSADINVLRPGASSFACLCQPKGRVIALLLVQASEDGAMVVCARELAPLVMQRLGMYVLRDDVSICERPDLKVHGEFGADGAEDLSPLPGLSYRLLASAEVSQPGNESWKAHELGLGVTWLAPPSSEEFLPQMLGFERIGALSFKKGCYPGQEVIARTRYLGKLKRHAVLLDTDHTIEPDPMEQVTVLGEDESAAAVVVDRAQLDSGATRLLLVVRTAQPFPASRLEWRDQALPVAIT